MLFSVKCFYWYLLDILASWLALEHFNLSNFSFYVVCGVWNCVLWMPCTLFNCATNLPTGTNKVTWTWTPHTPGQPAPCLFWEDFLALADQRLFAVENYAILNKRHFPTQRIITLETRQVMFFCDAMHPGTCRHCENGCLSRTTFSVN